MLATAVNPTVGLLSGRAKFPVNRGKFPVLREFRRAPRIFAALLYFGSGIEEYQGVGPDLFRFRARVRARARGTGATGGMQRDGGGRRARYAAIPPAWQRA